MIRKLQQHLTILFAAATGSILTLVLAVACFYQFQLTRSQATELFQNQLLDLTHRLEGTSSLSDAWLASLESDGKYIIHIEDNGTPLFFSGSWNPATDRKKLIELAKEKALTEGVNTKTQPYSLPLLKSSVFSIRGEHRDTYQGVVMVISSGEHFRSLVLLCDITDSNRNMRSRIFFFLLLEVLGVLALFWVSRQVVKKAVAPIEEYHRKQTDFIAAASHELRSPFAVIQTSASAILSMPEQSSKMAAVITQECSRAGNLLKNLLLLSSVDSNHLPVELETVEIDTLLLQVFESYEPLCEKEGIHLSLVLPEDLLPPVLGNTQWIYEILCILLDNAISYGIHPNERNPVIRLKTELQDHILSVSVTDYGLGIPDELKCRIFDRFYRADTSRSAKEHSGLGLNIAKSLADRMAIRLLVTDTRGGGSTFQIQFEAVCK